MQIPDEIQDYLDDALYTLESFRPLATEDQLSHIDADVEEIRAWLDSQPAGEWVPVEDGIVYGIGNDIEVADGGKFLAIFNPDPKIVDGSQYESTRVGDDIRLCRKTEANSE